uniref:NADH-ubiquinone oxidoreductase chain 3 n=1 Tax=Tetragnatha maxillosa TaxID=216284 RepID=A0A0A0YPH5_9ARAC|nr:NADH dehydrogenase subunit 3 [Tetragnatha maxillosa]AIX11770.1 NADH dehydrogenase subunit 3 [Tetragnatha maxillosa]
MIFVFIVSLLVMLVVCMSFYVVSMKKLNEMENMSVYECGFEGGVSSRVMFSYQFFLISILFLVFDVEVVLLIPFTFSVGGHKEMIFIFILLVGLIYELIYGSLEWL